VSGPRCAAPGSNLGDDEATANTDAETDAAIERALRLTFVTTTVVTIASLSTVIDADYILVLDGGRVAAWGSPADLLERALRAPSTSWSATWGLLRRPHCGPLRPPSAPRCQFVCEGPCMSSFMAPKTPPHERVRRVEGEDSRTPTPRVCAGVPKATSRSFRSSCCCHVGRQCVQHAIRK
jgi:hypothetical protein